MNAVEKSIPLTVSLSEEKERLISFIREALIECSSSRFPILEAANRLNERKVTAPKGKEWTAKSLGKYISSNRGWLMDVSDQNRPKQNLYTEEAIIRGFIEKMAESLRRGKSDTLIFVSVDKGLLESVKRRSASEDISLVDALDTALSSWVKRKKPKQKPLPSRVQLEEPQEDCGLPFDLDDAFQETRYSSAVL